MTPEQRLAESQRQNSYQQKAKFGWLEAHLTEPFPLPWIDLIFDETVIPIDTVEKECSQHLNTIVHLL